MLAAPPSPTSRSAQEDFGPRPVGPATLAADAECGQADPEPPFPPAPYSQKLNQLSWREPLGQIDQWGDTSRLVKTVSSLPGLHAGSPETSRGDRWPWWLRDSSNSRWSHALKFSLLKPEESGIFGPFPAVWRSKEKHHPGPTLRPGCREGGG